MDEKAKLNKKKMTLSENYGSSIDPIRNDIENYYIDNNSTSDFKLKKTYKKNSMASPGIEIAGTQTQILYNVKTNAPKTRTPTRSKLGIDDDPIKTNTYTTKISISASSGFSNELSSLFEGGAIFEDSYFEIGAPIEYASNVDNKSIIQGDVEFNYNYGSASYEFLTNQVSEQSIPNFYETPTVSVMSGNLNNLVGKETVVDYIISNADYYDTTALQQLSDNLPFFNMVSFTNPIKTDSLDAKIPKSVIDKGLSALFCDVLNLIQSDFPLVGKILDEKEYTGTSLISSYKEDSRQTEFSEFRSTFVEKLQKYDLSHFIHAIKILASSRSKKSVAQVKSDIEKIRKVFGKNELTAEDIITTDYINNNQLFEKLDELIDEFESIIEKHSRDFEDILAGIKPYCSDVLFYSIEKYEFGSSTPIQTFWVPSVFIYLGLDYIDLQVKYGKKYTYKVYAYKITLDTQLEYVPEEIEEEEEEEVEDEGRVDNPPDDKKGGGPLIEEGDLPQEVFETIKDKQGAGDVGSGKDKDKDIRK